jgi:hypothetical protein
MSLSLYSVVWVRKDPVCSLYQVLRTRISNTTIHTELTKIKFCQIHRLSVLLTSETTTGLQSTEYCSTVAESRELRLLVAAWLLLAAVQW